MEKKLHIEFRRRDDGKAEILYSTLEELQALWGAMTEGFFFRGGPDEDEKWIPPKDVFIDSDGEFRFKPPVV